MLQGATLASICLQKTPWKSNPSQYLSFPSPSAFLHPNLAIWRVTTSPVGSAAKFKLNPRLKILKCQFLIRIFLLNFQWNFYECLLSLWGLSWPRFCEGLDSGMLIGSWSQCFAWNNKKHLKNVGPIRHYERFYIAIHQVSLLSHAATVARRLRIYVHDNDDNNNDNAW